MAWPSASPAKALPAARAGRHRYFIVSSTWRDNATIFEPTGLVAAQVRGANRILVHELDLSFAILGWSSGLRNGEALREKYGSRVGFHYKGSEDMGLFWSNDPATPIGAMVRSIGGEELDAQLGAIAGCKTRPGKNSCRIHDERARTDVALIERTHSFIWSCRAPDMHERSKLRAQMSDVATDDLKCDILLFFATQTEREQLERGDR